jgi:hypothetical protein
MNRTTIGRGILAFVISCLAAAKIVNGFYKATSQTAAGNLAGAAGTALGTVIVVLLALGVYWMISKRMGSTSQRKGEIN